MKHQVKIEISNIDKTELIFKLEELLREYWGSYEFLIHFLERTEKNTEILTQDSQPGFTEFFAFQNENDFQYLRKNNMGKTLRKVEIFRFDFSEENLLDISFYNSADTFERERQFQRIISQIEDFLQSKIPHARKIMENGKLKFIQYKHRRGDGKTGFFFIPASGEEIYWEKGIFIHDLDFELLFPPIDELFKTKEDGFDWTSMNEITREEWEDIMQKWADSKKDKQKYNNFIDTVLFWCKEQLNKYETIDLYGNL